MSSNTVFDYATPYDIMVGLWTVQKIIYGPRGQYLDSTPSFVAVYWERRHKLMHFREDEPDTSNSSKRFAHRAAVAQVVSLEFDLKVNGKYSHGESSGVKVTGTETRPDVYHFHLKTKSGDWYNNHYLISPNERHILGPFVEKNGEIEWIVAQTLTRVSYDVPKKYKRGLRRSDK
jgi:hypothetical protein